MKTMLKSLIPAAFAVVVSPAMFAQTTGVSNPPPVDITADEAPAPAQQAKPSAAVSYFPGAEPAAQPTPQPAAPITRTPPSSTYGSYVPYNGAGTPSAQAAPHDPDAEIVTSVPSQQERDNPDSGVVTSVPSSPNEISSGALLHTRIRETLSTVSTPVGTRFTAEVTEPMETDGRVVIPAGSILHGRVTVVRGGRRISGAAAIHLLPESVTLPDGTHYDLHAQVVGTGEDNVTRVDNEGTILRRDHIKETLAVMSLTTGSATAAGAMLGGGVGAVVGAGIGAGVSTVWWLKQDRQEVIPQDTAIVFDLITPLSVAPITVGTN
jgi:hypothetical protein